MKKRILLRSSILIIPLLVALLLSMIRLSYNDVAAKPQATPIPKADIISKLQSYQLQNKSQTDSVTKQINYASVSSIGKSPLVAPEQQTFYSVADATILQGYPAFNSGNTIDMWAGYDEYLDPPGQIVRSLILFDISSLPSNQNINGATLRVFHVISWDYPDTSRTITSYRIMSNWSEAIVTWNNAPTYGEAYGSQSIIEGVWDWYEFDVTNLVRNWYDGTYQNFGIMLRGPEVSGIDSSWRGFATKESVYIPELVIQYEPISEAPIIAGLPDQQLPFGSNADNAIDLWAYTSDVKDADSEMVYTINNTPDTMAGVSIDSNRYIDINPASGWSGNTDVEIQVQDTDGFTDTDIFRVTVLSANNYLPLVLKSFSSIGTQPPTTTEPSP